MKKRLFFIFLLVAFALGIVLFVYKYVLSESLSWKTYNSSVATYSFKYPSKWTVCEEFYKRSAGNNEYFTHIYQGNVDCSNLPSTGKIHLEIYENNEVVSDSDIKKFLENEERKALESSSNGLPSVPGFFWKFVKYNNNLILVRGASTAQVEGIADMPSYVILYKHHVYGIYLDYWPKFPENLTIRLILWSLRFNIQ